MRSHGGAERTALQHLPLLDGWRALSITLVILGHLFPIGPSAWQLNAPVAATGMVMFFTLSGFLITRFLIEDGNIRRFLIRRLLRIVPLAWLGMFLAFLITGDVTAGEVVGNMFFVANLPPASLVEPGEHFWSLCLEVQFYLSVALLVAVGRKRALFAIPLICILITCARIYWEQPITIVTWFRGDEILAGATLALIYEGWLGERARKLISLPSIYLLLPLLFASADMRTGFLPYLRPYLSALLIGTSLYYAPRWLRHLSEWRPVTYVAQTSYALYVFHGIFVHTWLGTGDTLIKYAKRPLLLAATFVSAHLSTFHFERRWNALGRRLTPPREGAVANEHNAGTPADQRPRLN